LNRSYYSDSISSFCLASKHSILGALAQNSDFDINQNQRDAWAMQIDLLKPILTGLEGKIYFEYSIPRMGKRIDVLLLVKHLIFILEFKIGSDAYLKAAVDQVWDYALDLKNFHETSHHIAIVPILFADEAQAQLTAFSFSPAEDMVFQPILSNPDIFLQQLSAILDFTQEPAIDPKWWENGRYQPTPSIIEAALALYNGHAVEEISRSDSDAENLGITTDSIIELIERAKNFKQKTICFVTGVPGAGKTLVGLNIATQRIGDERDLKGVFLSGNGPLVAVLREALARDMVVRDSQRGVRTTKGEAKRRVKSFVQNVHHFRDECLIDPKPPYNHIAIFDEAQRAWNLEQTAKFMKTKKNKQGFSQSEPEFLISCMDRHQDWAVVICLVGGGQEINTGEAGIGQWIECLLSSFTDWHVYLSDRLTDSEYAAGKALESFGDRPNVIAIPELHLGVSMRSFRAEKVSLWVKQVLDLDDDARNTLAGLQDKYPIVLCRDLQKAKAWLKQKARGSERYGLVVSSQAYRLKPLAIDVRYNTDPVHWFLNDKEDVRSSYYLEDVATEFQVQGLELDWACITWDADFRYVNGKWEYWSFKGQKWQHIKKAERKLYLKNAYRVLLTRARQGMVIVVPEGDDNDHTRPRDFYSSTYEYLKGIGLPEL
jgi:DUF2075 family protein